MLLFNTLESIKTTYQLIISYLEHYQEVYPFGYFLFLIVLSVIFAQIIDILFSSFLYRLTKKTETTKHQEKQRRRDGGCGGGSGGGASRRRAPQSKHVCLGFHYLCLKNGFLAWVWEHRCSPRSHSGGPRWRSCCFLQYFIPCDE